MIETQQPSLSQRSSTQWWAIAGVITTSALVIGGCVWSATAGGEPAWVVFSDMASVTFSHPLVSAISSLAIMMWTAAAAVSLFAGAQAKRMGRNQESRFLVMFGLLTALLALDDQFLLHEWFLPLLPFGSQSLYVALYALLVVAFIATQHSMLRRGYPIVLLVGALFLCGSVGLDTAGDMLGYRPPTAGLGEDTFKFIGIGLWLTYAILTAWRCTQLDQRKTNSTAGLAMGQPEEKQ